MFVILPQEVDGQGVLPPQGVMMQIKEYLERTRTRYPADENALARADRIEGMLRTVRS